MSAEKYDDTLLPFLALMRRELHANSAKGDRPGWLAMQPGQCLLEIYWHVAKLSAAVKNGDQALIAEYAADVANMAMMQADIAGLLQPSVKSQARAASATPLVGVKCKNCHGTGRDGDTGADSRTIDIECGTCHGTGLTGRYRDICPDGSRCLSGCLANEPCYLAKSTTPTAQTAPAAGAVVEPVVPAAWRRRIDDAAEAMSLVQAFNNLGDLETVFSRALSGLRSIQSTYVLDAAPTPAAKADSVQDLQSVHDAVTIELLNERVAYLEGNLKEADSVLEDAARPKFWKGERVNYTNEHHVSFTAKVKKVETRWSADRKPYHYAHILIDGEKASTIVPQSYLYAIDTARKQGGTHD